MATHCAASSRTTSLASLSSLSLLLSAEIELSVLLARRALSSAVAARTASTAATASSSALLLPVLPSPALPPLPPSLQSLPPLARVPLPWHPRPPAGAARSRRLSAETVLRTWRTSGGLLRGKRLPQTSCCLSVQERRDEQGQPVFLLPAEDRGRCGKGMSRRYLGCRIEWL
jgi:hypothetical protein